MSRHDFCKVLLAAGLLAAVWAVPVSAEAPVFDADDYSRDAGQGEDSAAVTSSAPAETPAAQGRDASANDDDSAPTLTQGQRIDRLEQQIDNLQHTDTVKKLNQFQDELQFLRGKVEELTHQLEQLQTRQQTMYTDLDRRIGSSKPAVGNAGQETSSVVPVPTKKAPAVPVAPKNMTPAKAAQPNVLEEQQTYQLAYDLIKAEKYDQAVTTLQKMLRKYPSGAFAANAHYWLGELYGLQGKNALSANEFQTVLKQYPGSPRLADAGLKLGLIFAAELKWSEAKGAFRNVINRYPGTASARLASEQLKQIKQAGH